MSSLIEGNIYLYLFVDSYSRKCFPYYSKNKDEKDTLRIMKQHFKENVIGVLNEDVGNEALLNQVTSIQGDNGPSPHTLTDVRTEFLPAARVSNFK